MVLRKYCRISLVAQRFNNILWSFQKRRAQYVCLEDTLWVRTTCLHSNPKSAAVPLGNTYRVKTFSLPLNRQIFSFTFEAQTIFIVLISQGHVCNTSCFLFICLFLQALASGYTALWQAKCSFFFNQIRLLCLTFDILT